MFTLINKRETGVNLRRIMDMRGITPKDVQEYLGLRCVQSVYRWAIPYWNSTYYKAVQLIKDVFSN